MATETPLATNALASRGSWRFARTRAVHCPGCCEKKGKKSTWQAAAVSLFCLRIDAFLTPRLQLRAAIARVRVYVFVSVRVCALSNMPLCRWRPIMQQQYRPTRPARPDGGRPRRRPRIESDRDELLIFIRRGGWCGVGGKGRSLHTSTRNHSQSQQSGVELVFRALSPSSLPLSHTHTHTHTCKLGACMNDLALPKYRL